MDRDGPSKLFIGGSIGIVLLLAFIFLFPRAGSEIDETGDREMRASSESGSAEPAEIDERALLKECSAEDFESCRELARHFKRESDPVDVQLEELRDIISGCNEGENNACALIVAYGWKPQAGIDTSSFETACDKGDFPSCWVAARQFAAEAPRKLEPLCNEAFQPACALLETCKAAPDSGCGYLADESKSEVDWSKVVGRTALEPHYNESNESARNAAFDRWIVETRTLEELRNELARLCANDILACQTALVLDLRKKLGPEIESPMLEYALLKFGCERGDIESCSTYANLGFSTLGVEEPNLESTFLEACNEGAEEACSSYGYEVLNRDGGVAAAAALEPLCNKRKPGACDVLMRFYDTGYSGLERNTARVREIRSELCHEGQKKYCN